MLGRPGRVWFEKIKTRSAQETLGLVIGADQISFCVVSGGSVLRLAAEYSTEHESWPKRLADAVREHNLKGMPCHLILAGDEYKLLPVEVPDVPAAEVDQALLWSLRDVLEAQPQDMLVQSFPFAGGLSRPGRAMRHAVAVRKSVIRELADGVLAAGLDLHAIDIAELAMCALVKRLPEDERGVCVVTQGARNVVITLHRGGELYLARQLAGSAQLQDALHPLTGPRLVEQLGLDLLRTLDYYDSQLQQRPPAVVCLPPMPAGGELLQRGLAETLNLPVRQILFPEFVKLSQPLDAGLQMNCLFALGGALRGAMG